MLSTQFTYQLVRSARRTIGLEISPQGNLIVRAPHRASCQEIESLLREKERWIMRHQGDAREKAKQALPKQFVNGENFLFLGHSYPLTIFAEKTNELPFYFKQGFFLAAKVQPIARRLFLQWYYQQADSYINAKAQAYSLQHGLKYQSIRINNPKQRWGSCSVDNNLSFNWRLIMAPAMVVDYVVAHEVAHIVHKNHQKRFWAKVAKIQPDYLQQRHWLKEHGHLLVI